MSDEGQEPTPTRQEPAGSGQPQQQEQPQTFDAEYVKGLRDEAAKYRTKLREVEEAQEAERKAELEKQQKWQELAQEHEKKVQELEPIKARYEEMLERLRESNKRRIEQIPESMRDLIPDYEDPAQLATWLDTAAAKLAKPSAPSLNGGAGRGERPGDEVILSPEQLAIAKKMHITPEQYKAQLAKK
jgi:DNA repair exonuclease SbcCD ATPase subunit